MTKEQTQHEPDGLMAADYRSMYLKVRDELAAEQQRNSSSRAALQTQAERIKELEAEIITRTSYGDEQTDFAIKLAGERDALRARIAALANAEPAGWQPIDTAPKPYEEVMVWPYPSHNCITAQRNTIGAWTYSEYETGFGWTDHVCQPTHWMPLPAAPGDTP